MIFHFLRHNFIITAATGKTIIIEIAKPRAIIAEDVALAKNQIKEPTDGVTHETKMNLNKK